jgi:hypothetical protein
MDSKKPGRRRFLKGGAAAAGLAMGAGKVVAADATANDMAYSKKDLIAYGERSHFVTSIREPVPGRMSPDAFGLVFHVTTPLQDSVGIMWLPTAAPLCRISTPSSIVL